MLVFIRQHIGCFFKLRDAVSQLDVVVSLAQVVAHGVGFCRPQLADSLIIQHGRHPILNRFGETALVSNDTVSSITNTFFLPSPLFLDSMSSVMKFELI